MADSPVNNNMENTYLSFSNPNYHFESKKMDPQNDTIADLSTLSLLDDNRGNSQKSKENNNKNKEKKVLIDSDSDNLSSDGDDDDITSDDDNETYENKKLTEEMNRANKKDNVAWQQSTKKSGGFLGYYSMLETKAREKHIDNVLSPDTEDENDGHMITPTVESIRRLKFDLNSPDSNDSGIQSDARSDDGSHGHGPTNGDMSTPINKSTSSLDNKTEESDEERERASEEDTQSLPPGWEKCEDEDGPYYWHIKSGTIQREPPSPEPPEARQLLQRTLSSNSDASTISNGSTASVSSAASSLSSSNTDDHLRTFEGHALQYAVKSLQNLSNGQQTLPIIPPAISQATEKPVRFAVRSLGWVRIAEEDLTPERSSRAVNKCIVDLSLGRNDINDVVGRWGDGKDLYMDLDKHSLRLVDPQELSILNSQPIQSIRVWGVGRDNGRDFAYVARERTSKKHMCHVFRCDTPARQIANTLRDICKKIMLERKMHENSLNQRLSRPTDLPMDNSATPTGQKLSFQSLYNNASFPTPMEEPKKTIRCHYVGLECVSKPTGTDILNGAIDAAVVRVPPEKWLFVNVSIAPSTITIFEHGKPENKIDECRVRYLSFMGISISNIKMCAFIIHGAEDQFYAHVFHCEPTAGPLCKTIEAACKLRFQKCLDAHPQTPTPKQPTGKALAAVGDVIKSGAINMQTGVKVGAANVQAGVKKGLTSVQNVFGFLKTKAISKVQAYRDSESVHQTQNGFHGDNGNHDNSDCEEGKTSLDKERQLCTLSPDDEDNT